MFSCNKKTRTYTTSMKTQNKNIIVLENIRSAYNTWNIIRTADALWRDVILSWYTPNPEEDEKVNKTSLWAENTISITQYWNPSETLIHLKNLWYFCIASEMTEGSIPVTKKTTIDTPIAIIMWNEKTWVLKETLDSVDAVYHIPMKGVKESLNVWQAAAIMMWGFSIWNRE